MQIHTLISSENGPIILWVMYPHRGDETGAHSGFYKGTGG